MAKTINGLTKQQLKFCNIYLADPDRSAPSAYREAYPKCKNSKSASTAAGRLLKNVVISTFIDKHQQKIQQDAGITHEKVLQEMGRVAFLDPRKMFNKDGTLKAITELDDDTAAAVAGFEVEAKIVNKKVVVVTKVKFAPKTQSLEQLGKVFKMFTEKKEFSVGEGITFNLNMGKKR